MVLLAIALLFSLPAMAKDAGRILDSPVTPPALLLKQMQTLRLKASAGKAVTLYMAEQDARLIRQWLRSQGYLSASVAVVFEGGEARWRVHAGQLWRIRHINVSPAPIAKVVLQQAGEVFRSTAYDQAKSALQWSWRDAGYLKARFDKAVVIPDMQCRQVDIVWHIAKGPLFHISHISVEGAHQYAPGLAVKISRLQPGQIPTRQRLQDARQYLSSDSRYRDAIIVLLMHNAVGNQVPLRITVNEASWRKLTGDIGYSTDSGLALGSTWADRSLLYGNLEYSLRAKSSRTVSGAGASLMRPVWPENDQQVGANVDYVHVDTLGLRYDSVSGGPFWQWNFSRKGYLRVALQTEDVRESGADLVTLGPRFSLHMFRERGGLIPYQGWRLNAGMALPRQLNGQGLWAVLNISGRFFYRPASWLLLSPRAGFGRTLDFQGVTPKIYRQFAGGAISARGYKLNSLGPVGADGLATGGLMKTYAGLDLVLMPEARLFSPVLFGDVAKLWQTVGTAAPAFWSVGAGLIIRSPAGPLRFDLALPLNRRPQDAHYRFYFTLGNVF